jgi:hypothetical protein
VGKGVGYPSTVEPLAYQYGLFKLGIPGLVLLAVLAGVGLYRRKAGGNTVSTRMVMLLVALAAGVIALIDGYAIYGGGLIAAALVLTLLWALRGGWPRGTAATSDRRAEV